MKLTFNISTLLVALAAIAYLLFAHRDQPWNATEIAGAIIGFPSLVLLILARLQLGSSFAIRPKAQALVTHGLYSRIRNPIYFFGGFAVAGLCLAFDRPHLLWVLVVLVPLQIYRVRREEKVLTEKFGDDYLRYKARTWF